VTADEALAQFDGLEAVDVAALTGVWQGRGLHTGHPLDGLLEATGWYGKRFAGPEGVHPLVYAGARGLRSVDPARLPLSSALLLRLAPRGRIAGQAFRLLLPLLATSRPTARARSVLYRGVVSAALIYDRHPIIDHLRRLPDGDLLGAMDHRAFAAPLFFVLTRADATRA
jgi:hypothetical protein